MNTEKEQERRWASEAKYFNSLEYETGKIDPAVIDRYMKCERPFLVNDYEFVALGDLTGQTVLEVGCGDGWRSILMALRGAQVVALDLSSAAIEAARIRAAKHGVQDRIQFHVLPAELFQSEQKFDVVTAFALLHHIIPVLDVTLDQLKRFGKPGARYFFVEPVAPSRVLRKIRLMLPIAVDGTDDERPLEQAEFDIILRHFRSAKFTYYNAFTRIFGRFLNAPLEKASPWRRNLYFTAARIDQLFLQKLGFSALASVAFIEART
jgi:2-polyprenyl-3-methyl-5-hydroxy-6-metoxy-1,4-benzoquinol methylase